MGSLMRRTLTVDVHEEDGILWGQVQEEPGCFGTGDTLAELAESLSEGLSLIGVHPRFEDESPVTQSVEHRKLALC